MINKILLKIDKLKKNKLFWQIFLPLIALFLISLLAAFISLYKQGYYILGGDLYYPLKPQLDLLRNPFTWDVRYAAGGTSDARQLPSFGFFLYFYLLDKLSIPLITSQMIAIFSIFAFTAPAMYYLVLVIIQDQKNKIQSRDCLIAFIAGLFYNFNLWNLFNLSPPSVHLQLSYLATPIVLAFFIKGMRKFNFFYIFLIIVGYILIAPAASNPIYTLNTLWPIVFFVFFTLIKQISIHDWRGIVRSLVFSFTVLLAFILINLWWLLPMLNGVKTSISVAESSGNIWGWLDWKSKISSFLNIFRLTSHEAWGNTTPGALIIASANDYVNNPFLIIMSFIFPILAFSNLLKKKKNFYVLFFSVMTITMIFLAKGVHDPLGWFNKFLHQKILILSLYRSIEWYTPMIVLGYAYLLGEGSLLVYDFFKKRKNWLAGTFIMTLIIAIFIFNYPFWTGKVVHQGPWTGEMSYPYFVKIPSWYFEASDWINNQNDDFKIVSGPSVTSYYCADWGYAGGELGIFLFNKSIINNIFGWGGIKDISFSINSFLVNKSFVKDDIFPLGQILGLVNAKYIALRYDAVDGWRNHIEGADAYLIANQLKLREDISLEKTIGRIDFFKNNMFLPHFYIPKNIIYSNGEIESLPDIISSEDYEIRSGIYFDSSKLKEKENLKRAGEVGETTDKMPKITFVKINPTKYRVKIEGAKEPYTLVFSESFHEGWKAYISDQQSVISDQYGGIVASYFDGEVKEGTHRNIFLDKNTFETWGKKPIPEEKHLLVNGYANSWYITPEDAGAKEDYEIIIEFWPQRLFYIGLTISAFTLLGCLCYLVYDLYMKKKRLNIKQAR